ncbi:MAG: efflux RND transporter periplasmic adaptor subunit [Paracraurococcus sp.]
MSKQPLITGIAVLLTTALLSAASAQVPRIADESFDCLMDASARVNLGAQVAGVLRAVHVTRGDRVEVGRPIAQLASEVEEATALLARVRAQNDTSIGANEAKLDLARRRLARIASLRATGTSTEKDYDEANAEVRVAALTLRDSVLNLEAARAEMKRAEEQLAQRRILSPITGVVVERHLSPGEYVHDQAHIVTLASIDVLHVEVYVPVAFFGRIVRGGRAVVLPEAPVGGRHAAEVMVVDRVIDAASGTFGVRLRLPNPDWQLPAGLRCRVQFSAAAE